jgi:hypothetical protein
MNHPFSFLKDRWTATAAILFAFITVFFVVNTFTEIAKHYPIVGIISYSMVPFIFVIGAGVFVIAILKSEDK